MNVMKHMGKYAAAVAAAAMMMTAGAGVVHAAETEQEGEAAMISPGIRVLAARCTVKKNAAAGEEMTFSAEDFAAVLGYTPAQITLQSLPDPSVGVLKLGTMPLAAGAVLSSSVLEGVRFSPTGSVPAETSFLFTARGGAYESTVPLACMLYQLTAENGAPTAEAGRIVTYEDIPVSVMPAAADPESDGMTYEIVRHPRRGTAEFTADGMLRYTPDAGVRGADSVSWYAVDRYGSRSETVTTRITVRRAGEELYYADLDGHSCAAQAMVLTEEGIFRGTSVGAHALFSPDTEMARGEFLVCAMRAAGYGALPGADLQRLGVFENADEIPDWMTGYLASAYEDGILRGGGDGVIRFDCGGAVTHAEAAVLLHRLFDLGTPQILPVFSEEISSVMPDWSVGAVSAAAAAGIPVGAPDTAVTRADAAVMLAGAMGYGE